MRAFDKGSTFGVQCTCDDVEAFAARWPCSGMRAGDHFRFEFDKLSGDLVDINYGDRCRVSADRIDGAAMVALSQDAQRYGVTRFGLVLV